MRSSNTRRIALCGVLAALAVALMFFGGTVAFASIACPVLASLVLIPVYAECGNRWGLLWFLAVTVLAALLAPDKECAILFAFFGYYPMLRHRFGRLRSGVLRRACKLLYVNAAIFAAYGLMLFVFKLEAQTREFAETERWMLAALLLLGNVTFAVYDKLVDRLEILYHAKLRSKFKL